MRVTEGFKSIVWNASRRIGLSRQLLWLYTRVQLLRSGGYADRTVDGTTVRFRFSNWFEYKRIHGALLEESVLEALLADLDGDEIVWDVGATIGTYSCFIGKRLTTGHVVGFEPEPENRERLRANLRRSAPSDCWQVEPIALADRDGKSGLAQRGGPARPVPGLGHYYLSDEQGEPVECRRGDSLVADGYSRPDVLKIDVQGAEFDVLRGLEETLSDVGVLYLEVHPHMLRRYGTDRDAVEGYLRERGFSLTQFDSSSERSADVYHIRAEQTDLEP